MPSVGIHYPTRISIEHGTDFRAFRDYIDLRFHGLDDSVLMVRLSEQQAMALGHWNAAARNPQRMARDLYVAGHIEIDEFERRLERG